MAVKMGAAVDKIGRFRILEEIGRGAMGVVYRAQDPAIGRIIAIKMIALSSLTDLEERERLRERLFREAQSAGILSHPNIVTIYDIAEEQGQACIFMEYVNGPSLENLLASEPPSKQVLSAVWAHTAAALDYAHRKGIVHRDIKPANIMIHEDGQAKITDFGVAKIISQQMTHSGNMMGTPNYMSPEQVQGLAVDGRADQFALAVIIYETLTGEKPFTADYLPTLLYKIVREDPVPPQRLNPSLGSQVDTVLHKALSKDPQDRYGTCSEFIAALEEAFAAAPAWTPLPRGASANMPTLAENAPPPVVKSSAPAGLPAPAILAGGRREQAREERDRNPLLKSLIWVLVGLGLLGVVIIGAEKFVFNQPGAESTQAANNGPPAAAENPAPSPNDTPPADLKTLPGEGGQQQTPTPPPAKNPPEKPSPLNPDSTRDEAQAAPPARRSEPVSTLPAPAKGASSQAMQMLTEPPGATITVDGNPSLSCRTPCILQLSPGRHTLDTQLQGYRPYPRILNVPQDGDSVFLKLAKLTGTLSITSNPAGASIQINGETKPEKTPAAFALVPGTYHIRVTRNGVPLDFSVDLKDGEFQTRNVNFQ